MADQLYRSFLLRLWQARSADGTVWRASLEDGHTGLRLGFSSIDRLHEFLLDQTKGARNQPNARTSTDTASTVTYDDSY